MVKPLRILVTDAHTRAGLGAIRSLGRAGHTVIAGYSEDQKSPASVWSRYCSGQLRYPSPRHQQFAFRDWLRAEGKRGTLDAVWPVAEASLVAAASVRKELPGELLVVLPSDSALMYTLSKFHATRMALSLGIPCPATAFVSDGTSTGEWDEALFQLRFPVVIKTDNHLTADGAYEPGRKFVASNADEARRTLNDLEHLGTPIIAQEMIDGSGTAAFLLRVGGKTHFSFAHRRLHEVPYTGGWSSYRESCRDDELVRFGETILDAIGYEGVAMVEFRRGRGDGRPYFLEINGRLWGSLALALHCGVDFPAALIDCYQNGAPAREARAYRPGIKCRTLFPGELDHLLSILRATPTKDGRRPPSKVGAVINFFLLSLNPMIRHDHFWWSDPVPGIRQAAGAAAELTGKLGRGWRELGRHRGGGMVAGLRVEHRARCQRPRYFDGPLKRVMFLCYGNICRSPFAMNYWNARIEKLSLAGPVATSAGFHPQTGRRTPGFMAELARAHNVNLTQHRSRVLTSDGVSSADAIFVMDRGNYRELLARFPGARPKTYLLRLFADDGGAEIADPYNRGRDDVRMCCEQLVASLDGLMARVSRE